MLSFSLAIEKKTSLTVGRAEGHNTRLHPTRSQLPQQAWFSASGCDSVTPWRADVLNRGKALAKRKDAVVAIELVVQLGDQTDWREMPTSEHPHGKPKAGIGSQLKLLSGAVREAAVREFGEDNIVGIDLHLDESSPHVHVVVVPERDGKLQAKHWVGGALKCAQLRARIHEVVDVAIPCTYEKGAPGGLPHDPDKAAGGKKARQPPKGLLGKAADLLELKSLKEQLRVMKAQLQTLFSRLKKAEKRSEKEAELRKAAEAREAASERSEARLRKQVKELMEQVEQLKPKSNQEPDQAPKPRTETKINFQ